MSRRVKLSEIASFQTGPFGTQLKASEYSVTGTPVINVKNIGYGNLILNDLDYVPATVCSRLSNHLLKEGDIVFGRKGSVDRHCYIREENENWMQGSDCIRMRVDKGINSRYISYYLMLDRVKKQINNSSVGSTMASINTDILKTVEVILPELEEQNLIATLFSRIDEKIENSNRINNELESMAKTIYDYWFLQFEFPNEEGKPYKSSGGKMVWNEELKREIPVGWKVDSLGNLFTSNRGISYTSKTIEGDGVPMINLASFNIDGSYKESGIKTYSGQYTTDKMVKPFNLLMCNTQQTAIDYEKDIIGKAFLVPDIFEGDIVTSHHVTTIQVKNDNMKYFLHRLFNTDFFHRYVSGYTNGTNILGLIFSGVEKYRLEVPDGLTLKKFADLMKDIERKKSRIIKENQELVSLRDFLLPLLMNGQVSFKNTDGSLL